MILQAGATARESWWIASGLAESKKEEAHVEKWIRELGPSNDLRNSFGHDPARWQDFRSRYLLELGRPEAAALLDELLRIARRGTLTLVYSAKDQEHNQAVVLKELLDRKLRST